MNLNINHTIPVNILLVDDREENLFSLQSLLDEKRPDISFIHATSGNEALKIAYKTELALILLDVQMPDMDGYEVASLLKQKHSTQNIPIIFVTALNHESRYIAEGYSKGAVDYLFKPLDAIITKSKVNAFVSIYQQQKRVELAYKDLEKIVVERTEDLNLKNEALSRINKDLDQFVYVASHDLKLPLANFEGLIQAFREDFVDMQHPSNELLDMMNNSVMQMKDTVFGLISIIQNKVSENGFEDLPFRKLVEEVESSISTLLSESKALILIHPESMEYFKFNKTVFKSALFNLISNAVKYRHPERIPKVELALLPEATHTVLTVKDNSRGMNEEALYGLFKLFSRVNNEGDTEGTGMGMYNLKNMLEKYNAHIHVQSEEGIGTEFKVVFK